MHSHYHYGMFGTSFGWSKRLQPCIHASQYIERYKLPVQTKYHCNIVTAHSRQTLTYSFQACLVDSQL
jgi:hypothetical protein